MNLFIDANIFLNFYHLSGEDIEELNKLVSLLDSGDIKLFSSKQLNEEVRRNRDNKISDAMKDFHKHTFRLSFPAFCKQYPEYNSIQILLKDANAKHAELVKKSTDDIRNNSLKADELIKKLLSEATNVEIDSKMFGMAVERFRLGNPPGKKKVTLGDELNWETLLAGVPDAENLHFVSGDTDYTSPVNPEALNTFLDSEWKEKKNSEILFYKSLSAFFKKNHPEIKLASDIKLNKLIERLASSGSFATTHAVISELEKFADFTIPQVEELIRAAEINAQINWIIDDVDVKDFYQRLHEKYFDAVSPELQNSIVSMLGMNGDVEPEEIPF